MTSYRTIFMGSPEFAVPTLVALENARNTLDLVGVVTQPDKPKGRGRKLTPCPVKAAAVERNLPVITPKSLRSAEALKELEALRPDLVVVAAYGKILPPTILSMPAHGCINVHASLLPRHRGASPIAHSIIEGDPETGVSIMHMDEGLDTGPVYGYRSVPVRDDHTRLSLTAELATLGAELLVDMLGDILAGKTKAQAQDSSGATYAPMLKKADGLLDFTCDANTLARRVRGLNPWPATFTTCRDTRVVVIQAHATDQTGAPGEVLEANRNGIVVACGQGSLLLTEVQPAGRKRMPAAAWVAGRGAQVGDVMGTALES